MDVFFNEKQPFFPNPYLQVEPFAKDKEFFSNLPTLPQVPKNDTRQGFVLSKGNKQEH